MEHRMHGRRRTDGHKHVLFAITLVVIFGAGFWGYKFGLIIKSNKDFITGNTANNFDTQIQESYWKVIKSDAFILEPNQIFMAFSKESEEIITKYKLDSDKALKAFWTESEEDCRAAAKDEAFQQFAGCSPNAKILEFKSGECKVPGTSGICLINNGDEEIQVRLKIERKM